MCDCAIVVASLEGCMAKILEEIQTRLGEAQKQLADTTQALTIAQQKQQTAQHSFNVWVAAAQLEQRDEQLRQAAATEKQSVLPLPATRPEPSASIPPIPIEQPVDASEGPNKTDVVRNLLKQHPTGMSAVDIWKEVGAQFKHRPYL